MNPKLEQLQPYPFERLTRLKSGVEPDASKAHIALSIGEPKHRSPQFVLDKLCAEASKLGNYPTVKGIPELRVAIAQWLARRFDLGESTIDPDTQVLPVNGTREALFSFAQAVIDSSASNGGTQPPSVLMPNPFYQIYEGAALLAGAKPVYMNCLPENNYQPDYDAISEDTWRSCQLLFLCSPGNPTGAVTDQKTLIDLMNKAEKYDFVIASDECYSEIYRDENAPPVGLLQAAKAAGNDCFERCLVFHSLSKRSNLPGLRSGFVAGDASLLTKFHRYRTYHGCAMPINSQLASIDAWNDEKHVRDNRDAYRDKFSIFKSTLDGLLNYCEPDASFYVWARTPISDETFARELFRAENITCLPGSYLGRINEGVNPGNNHVRIALVSSTEECREAATRIRRFLENNL